MMKKAVSILRSYLGHAGAYFMFVMLVFGLISYSVKSTTVNLPLIWSALLFGGMVAFFDFLFVFPLIRSYVVNVFIHGIFTVAAFGISFVWASGLIERGKTGVFGVLFFSVLYIILAVIRCVYHFATTKKENEKAQYTNLSTPKDVD
jgi:hypothetical protein